MAIFNSYVELPEGIVYNIVPSKWRSSMNSAGRLLEMSTKLPWLAEPLNYGLDHDDQ